MKNSKAIRWSDNDRYFGPFTYSSDKEYRPFAVVLGSGDGDEHPKCRLRMSALGQTLIVALPAIISPWRKWVDTSRHEWSGPNGGYWDTGQREYGFSLSDGFLNVSLGRSTNDSSTEQWWGWFLPWTQWRHVRHSFYDSDGQHVWTKLERKGYDLERIRMDQAKIDGVPTVSFEFTDFDGELLQAETRIEEREWRFGTGYFKWLSIFRKPKISRSLDIRFSGETGKRKGSWKGGTIGSGIDMLSGELHEASFRRYCHKNNMSFMHLSQK